METPSKKQLTDTVKEMYDLLSQITEDDFVSKCADEGLYCNRCDGNMYYNYRHSDDCLYSRIQKVLERYKKFT